MKKNLLVVVIVFVVLFSGIVSPARACGEVCNTPPQHIPSCIISPLNPTVKAGGALIFDGSGSNADQYLWKMNGDAGFESKFDHLFDLPGTFELVLYTYDEKGNWNVCRTNIMVEANTVVITPVPEITPTPIETPITSNTTDISVSGTMNDGNIAPIINGDHNVITITTNDSHDTISDDHSTVNKTNNTSEAEVVQEPIKTTPKSLFWQFVKSILDWFVGPANSWIQWIIVNK